MLHKHLPTCLFLDQSYIKAGSVLYTITSCRVSYEDVFSLKVCVEIFGNHAINGTRGNVFSLSRFCTFLQAHILYGLAIFFLLLIITVSLSPVLRAIPFVPSYRDGDILQSYWVLQLQPGYQYNTSTPNGKEKETARHGRC